MFFERTLKHLRVMVRGIFSKVSDFESDVVKELIYSSLFAVHFLSNEANCQMLELIRKLNIKITIQCPQLIYPV